jgi:rare lipoprotein A
MAAAPGIHTGHSEQLLPRLHTLCPRMRLLVAAAGLVLVCSGCRHRAVSYAPPPPVPAPAPPSHSSRPGRTSPGASPTATSPAPAAVAANPADLQYVSTHAPLLEETGTASWYGPPYDRHLGANGEVFDQNMLSAAHRTLPMGSLLRVTNVATGQSTVLHVTDRGPFVPGRVLDLSVAAAKSIGVWLPGTAQVRIEVFQAPHPIAEGGRWCVQIGAFQSEGRAVALEHQLQQSYPGSQVIEFTGPTGHWVRIRPQGDSKAQAISITRATVPAEGAAFLVRLD